MDRHIFYNYRYSIIILYAVAIILFCREEIRSQSPLQITPAPPPLRFVSSEDKTRLNNLQEPKSRVRIGLELAENRLKQAEGFASQQKFNDISKQLGFYQGLIEDGLNYMSALSISKAIPKKKLRDLYKQIDLALRNHISRIELIGREIPAEFTANIKLVSDFTQNARFAAINGFFGDDVIKPESQSNPSDKATAPTDRP